MSSDLSSALRCLLAGAVLLAAESAAAQDAGKEDAAADEAFETQIFVANADGTDSKRLAPIADYESQGSPHWSSDGKRIAFDSWRPRKGEKGVNARIVVVNADGTNPRIFGDGAMPSLSPKGNRIAYSRYGKGVWVMSALDPEEPPAQLDEAGWGTDWSPDGTRVAFTRGPNIVVYDLVEGTMETVLDGAGRYRQVFWNFAWSPDSRKIAFKATTLAGKATVAVVDARGAKHGLENVYDGQALPALAWNPIDGRVLVSEPCAERKNLLQLFTLSADAGGKPTLYSALPADRGIGDACFSPDGKKICFVGHKRAAK